MKKVLFSLMTVLLILMIAGCGAGDTEEENNEEAAEENTKDQTITFGVTPWTSTVPPTKIARLIVEDMGYEVEEISADVSSIYVGLSRGDISAYMDSWMPVHETYLNKYEENVEKTAKSYGPTESGVVVPEYMEDVEKVSDLKGKEEMLDHTFYGLEKGGSNAEVIDDFIEEYDLDLEQLNSSEGGMLAEARRHMTDEEPVVFYGWRPHTMFNKMDIKVLEDEKKVKEDSSVYVMTNKELKESAPDVYEFLSNWSIEIDDLEEMMMKIEDEGQDPEEVAREWVDNNQDKVNEMINGEE
ncbi:glycine betaine ABC transporter substrate-binding protein [Alteribacillus iranensis]|uniref:Glycine betaine/proline transport system substrate-binding protein n=1 Tax=Alteribacillus iranensis TaxID=930128 RepID=A0A1I2DNN0_9BACI|nr:glycine betaine ABC transporter substrate-binding protein [Alteribacillus iranensis]SFE81883.1 glycine betaine/proline transport system substrate-binding protein [Alteribacillus iranensis]